MMSTVLVLVAFVGLPAEASKRWDAGVRGGFSLSGLYGSDADTLGTSNRNGFTGGVYGTTFLSPNVGIRGELGYTQRGATDSRGGTTITAAIDYIDALLLVAFERELTPGRFYGSMQVGPMFSFKTKATYKGVATDLDAITKGMDFAGVIGATVYYHIGSRVDIDMTARYTVGFVSIDDRDPVLDYRNYGVQLLLGVRKRLGYW